MPRLNYKTETTKPFDDERTYHTTSYDFCVKCYQGYKHKFLPFGFKPENVLDKAPHPNYDEKEISCKRCLKLLTAMDN